MRYKKEVNPAFKRQNKYYHKQRYFACLHELKLLQQRDEVAVENLVRKRIAKISDFIKAYEINEKE